MLFGGKMTISKLAKTFRLCFVRQILDHDWRVSLLDCLMAFFVVGPLVVIFWRSVWMAVDLVELNCHETKSENDNITHKLKSILVDNYPSPITSNEDNIFYSTNVSEYVRDFMNGIIGGKSSKSFDSVVKLHEGDYDSKALEKLILDSDSLGLHSRKPCHKMYLNLGLYLLGSIVSFMAIYGQFKVNAIMSPYSDSIAARLNSIARKRRLRKTAPKKSTPLPSSEIPTHNQPSDLERMEGSDLSVFERGQREVRPEACVKTPSGISCKQIEAEKRLATWWKRHLLFPLYSYVLGIMTIFLWRGFWAILNTIARIQVGEGGQNRSSLIRATIILTVGLVILIVTGSVNNCITVPLNILCDWNVNNDIYLIPTYLKIKPKSENVKWWKLLLDSFITVYVLENAVICVWNGTWHVAESFGAMLGEPVSWWVIFYFASSCLPAVIIVKSLIYFKLPCVCYETSENSKNPVRPTSIPSISYTIQCRNASENTVEIEPKSKWLEIIKITALNILKILVRYVILLIGFVGVMTYWIGIWLLLDYYVQDQYLTLLHWLSFLCLNAMFCANSLPFRGIIWDKDYFALKTKQPSILQRHPWPCGFVWRRKKLNDQRASSSANQRTPHQDIFDIRNKSVGNLSTRAQIKKPLSNKWLIPSYFAQSPWILR